MKVFISSTVYDLLDIRFELHDMLTASGYEVLMSEVGSSNFEIQTNESSIECCLSNVRNSDVMILITDRRYGPTLEEFGYPPISATHLEFKEATEKGIPVYSFMRDRTEADLTSFRKAKKSNSQWEGGHWVNAKDSGLLKMIDEHAALGDKSKNNWISTFRTSVDLKTTVASILRVPRYNADLAWLVSTGKVPILSVSSSCDISNVRNGLLAKFKATISNKCNHSVFVEKMEWSHGEKHESGLNSDPSVLPPGGEITSGFVHSIDASMKHVFHLLIIYSTYDGLKIVELRQGKFQILNEDSMLHGMTMTERKFYVGDPIVMELSSQQ